MSHLRRLSNLLITVVIFVLALGLVWLSGGTARAYPHLMYLPILFASVRIGAAGGAITGAVAGLAMAIVPMSRTSGQPQDPSSMLIQFAAYMTAGVFIGLVIQRLRAQQVRIQIGFIESAAALVNALEAAHQYTAGHSQRVAELSAELGTDLGLSRADVELLHIGGLLHDMGKVGVPREILNKPDRLTAKEFEVIKDHPAAADRILAALSHPRMSDIHDIVRHHHERLDGTGYPDRLCGKEVSLFARIVAVADVYDAVTSRRPYREALDPQSAVEILRAEAHAGRLDQGIVDKVGDLVERGLNLGHSTPFSVHAGQPRNTSLDSELRSLFNHS